MPKNVSTLPGGTTIQDGEVIAVKSDGSGWESKAVATPGDIPIPPTITATEVDDINADEASMYEISIALNELIDQFNTLLGDLS